MELDIDEGKKESELTFGLVAKAIAEKEADLLRREDQILRERAMLEQAKKYLETTKVSLATVLNALLQSEDPGKLDLASLVSSGERAAGPTGPTGPMNYGDIRRAVYETVSRFTNRPFSSREVLNYLRLWHPQIKVESNRANISSYLRDFVSEGLIELREEGSGNRPAIYQNLHR